MIEGMDNQTANVHDSTDMSISSKENTQACCLKFRRALLLLVLHRCNLMELECSMIEWIIVRRCILFFCTCKVVISQD
jgi:hypothetical protein